MGKASQLLLTAALFGAVLWLGPNHASAATSKCHFSKHEKIAMVSWVMLVPGAVITGLSCKRDLFQQVGKRDAAVPAKNRNRTEVRILDRRGRVAHRAVGHARVSALRLDMWLATTPWLQAALHAQSAMVRVVKFREASHALA